MVQAGNYEGDNMQGQQILKVGDPWPFGHTEQEGMTAVIDRQSIDLVCVMNGISAQERTIFKKGKLKYGCTVIDSIPFIFLSFKHFSFDCYINSFKEPKDRIETYTMGDPKANLVQIFLVDGSTSILTAIRAVGTNPDFNNTIKKAIFAQPSVFQNAFQLDSLALNILNTHQTIDLMKSGMVWAIG